MIITSYLIAAPTIVGACIAAAVLLVVLFFAGYVKASPDTAYIISGLRKHPKVFIGRAGFKVPFFEKKDELSLQLIPIDVKTSSAVPTADYININVDAAVNIKISDSSDKLKLAAQNFLNKRTDYIAGVAREVLEGNMREIVGKMYLKEMVSDRQKFAELVKENAEPDLAAMGLEIISFNVQNFVDSNGAIEDLGVDNLVRIRKDAAISRAESEKEIARAQAIAGKEANDAKVLAATEIAIKNNELAIKEAELKRASDTVKAEADAAYTIQQEEQRKTVEITTANANIARQEKEIELKTRQVEITEKMLEAEIKKKAEAERFARQQKSEADLFERQKRAEAEKFERAQEAEAFRIKADADKYQTLQASEAMKAQADADRYAQEQMAEAIRIKGEAEAEAIRAKLLAEAEGTEKKALAMQKMSESAILEMYFKVLPDIIRSSAQAYENVDKIVMFGSDTSTKLTENVMTNVTSVLEGLKGSTGIDLNALLAGFLGGKVASVPASAVNAEEPVAAASEE